MIVQLNSIQFFEYNVIISRNNAAEITEKEKAMYNKAFDNKENCTTRAPFPEKTPIGIAYIPFQQWEDVYSVDTAYEKATLFPSLDLPFMEEYRHD